ncbi:MAG TPA: glycosyltransferase, partial [Longimicrobiales bacterium]|nr:glycosyltransferase [Longimicrobiales bacterium]
MSSRVRRLALVGNHLPRRCGIATFTTHLSEAIGACAPDVSRLVIPVDDRPEGYDYPDPVRFVLQQNELESYREAADFLNINRVDAVVLQHEFGIFGGVAGAHVLTLVDDLRMPRITALHTVPSEPTPDQRAVLTRLADASDVLVVLAEEAVRLLDDVYGVPRARVRVIPHGIPDVPFTDPAFHKDRFGVEGKVVLLTLGLLGPGKGIEYAIDALPAVIERFPDVVYIVLGATHPNVVRHEGERYRLSLQQRARERGVDAHVIFLNRFVTEEELVECIGAADIYLTPYLNPDQIVSGTLAYSVGAGKAVVST